MRICGKGPPQSESFHFNLTMGHLVQGQTPNSVSYGSGNSSLGLWSNGTPNTISVTVKRIGYITINDGSVSVYKDSANNDIKTTKQLSSYGTGFLYNNLVSEAKLQQTDLFHPSR